MLGLECFPPRASESTMWLTKSTPRSSPQFVLSRQLFTGDNMAIVLIPTASFTLAVKLHD
jgi:hypothetical protein